MMPSHMVANGGSELRRDSTAATPLDTFLAQQHINANTLPKWRVRDGYCPVEFIENGAGLLERSIRKIKWRAVVRG